MALRGRRYLTPATIARLGNLQLVARLVVEGITSGQHKSPFYGFNVEFSEHRRYMPGDELRHIDWRLFGKSDKYYVKLYEENTSLRSYLLLDSSKSMNFGGGPLNKLEYAKSVVASLAYLLLHQKDSVGLATFSSEIHELLPPSSKASHLHRMVEVLDQDHGRGETDLFAVLRELTKTLKRRALVIIVSDFFDEEEKIVRAVKHLRFLKHEVILLRILSPEEIDFPYEEYSQFIDLEDGGELLLDPRALAAEYRLKMDEHLKSLRRQLNYVRVDTELFRTDSPLEESIARFLSRRARRRTA